VVHFEALGLADVEAGVPMRRDTIFRIASFSKAVTSVAAMMLVEEGHLQLTDPVSKYLPAFAKTTVVEEAAPGAGNAQDAFVDGPRKCFSGGAGLLSTAADYARFLTMLLGGGQLDGTSLLSPKTVQLMTANHGRNWFPVPTSRPAPSPRR
jgi:CubicO group peptidase (beta-lactamase class C family)